VSANTSQVAELNATSEDCSVMITARVREGELVGTFGCPDGDGPALVEVTLERIEPTSSGTFDTARQAVRRKHAVAAVGGRRDHEPPRLNAKPMDRTNR
jgi:hypothetical protein